MTRSPLSWSDPRIRALVWQFVVVALVCAIIATAAIQATSNLRARGVTTGFDYPAREARFDVNEPNPFFNDPRHARTRLFLSQILH
jgi:ABC-type amino acid transport system permease subunit